MERREHVENESDDHRPRTSITDNIHRFQQLLEGDRRLMVVEIVNEVGISYGNTFSIITGELGYANWVHRLVTSEQKLSHLQMCVS